MLSTGYLDGNDTKIHVHNLAKELIKRGIAVKIVAPHHVNTKNHEFIDRVEVYRFQYWFTKQGQKLAYGAGIPYNLTHLLLAKVQLPFFLLSFFLKGLRIAKQCDIIHAQFLLSGFVGVFIKKLLGHKLVITAHGSDIYMIPEGGLMKKTFITIISQSDSVIAVSNANKRKLVNLHLKERMIKVIHNGVSLSVFKKESSPRANRKEPHIIWVGRMTKEKGLEYLIKAMKITVTRYPNSKLTLVGDGPLKKKLGGIIKELSLNDNIIFTGFVKNEEVFKYLKNADIFVLPSLSEGLPIVALEAMAAGKTVIASDVGGTSEVVKDGITGFLVEPKNPEMLAEKIHYIIKHPQTRKNMEDKSRKLVEKKFTWEKTAGITIELYKNLL